MPEYIKDVAHYTQHYMHAGMTLRYVDFFDLGKYELFTELLLPDREAHYSKFLAVQTVESRSKL